jgi:hypothetical protein
MNVHGFEVEISIETPEDNIVPPLNRRKRKYPCFKRMELEKSFSNAESTIP